MTRPEGNKRKDLGNAQSQLSIFNINLQCFSNKMTIEQTQLFPRNTVYKPKTLNLKLWLSKTFCPFTAVGNIIDNPTFANKFV
jgi:hypothetical protein